MSKKVGILISLIIVCLFLNISVVGAAPSSSPKESKLSSSSKPVMLDAWENAVNTLQKENEYVPGELLIKFVDSASATTVKNTMNGVEAKQIKSFKGIGTQHWRLGKGVSVDKALKILSKPAFKDDIEYAEPNYIIHATALPNDPMRNELYGMHNLGQTGGTSDADIDALEAWESGHIGSSSIVVGVIDSGIDYNHEDLSANIWTNPNEIPNNNIDDDGNGYVDDVRGWDFVSDDNDPMDDFGHGTHCAGTIGAMGNNGKGVVGVNWNVKLMPLKFLNAGGSGKTDDAVDAVLYAADKGVRITSNSWGGGRKSKTLENAIKNSGSIFVAAAGNSGSSKKMLPAGYTLDNIISVAATDHDDGLWSRSNYGSDWVDLGAPGVNILSTTPGDNYGTKRGTSMATPHVAGVAALVLAKNPTLTNAQVKTKILNTVDSLSSLSGKTLTGGRLNARAAVSASEFSDSTVPAAVTDIAVDTTATTENSIKLTWTATGDDGSTGTAYIYDVRYVVGSSITDWASATQASGEPLPQSSGASETFTVTNLVAGTKYAFAMKVSDEVGGLSALSNVATETTKALPPGAWSVETVDSTGNIGYFTSLALDSSGNPHIAYSASTNFDAKYAKWTGSSWSVEIIPDTVANVGRWSNLVLESGTTHIIYFDDTNHQLRYAKWTTTASWEFETIDASGPSNGNWNSMVLDSSGKLHISYRLGYDNTGGGLKYAKESATGWSTDVVEKKKGAGLWGTSIAIDASENPHIAYHDQLTGKLRYAYWTGSRWKIETVDEIDGGAVGEYCNLALEADGTRHIAYRDVTNGNVKYALWNPSTESWSLQTVDSSTNVGNYLSMALDSGGNPHMSYRDNSNADLKYAYWTDSTWSIEIVESDVNVGLGNSLTLDSSDNPHIAYRDDTNADLRYARKTG